jgi:hypothetical protein
MCAKMKSAEFVAQRWLIPSTELTGWRASNRIDVPWFCGINLNDALRSVARPMFLYPYFHTHISIPIEARDFRLQQFYGRAALQIDAELPFDWLRSNA